MTNEVIKAILDRRSIRSYTDAPVETDKLETIIHAAINSPSARNLQPWQFTVIRNQALIAELDRGENIFYGAPAIIMISADSASRWAKMDAGMATQTILLAAHSLGLGTCVIGRVMGYLDTPEAAETLAKLHLPEGYAPLYAITVGYPAVEPEARPRELKAEYID